MTNAAGRCQGMAGATVPEIERKPLIGATMFGVTTPYVTRARERLEELGYEVLIFGATGKALDGGATRTASSAACSTCTTTELADELPSAAPSPPGQRPARSGRRTRYPGGLARRVDMVDFGSRRRCPSASAARDLYVHNPTVVGSCARRPKYRSSARHRARALRGTGADGPVRARCAAYTDDRRRGAASVPRPGGRRGAARRHHRDARRARRGGRRIDADVNDPAFAVAMAERLHELIEGAR